MLSPEFTANFAPADNLSPLSSLWIVGPEAPRPADGSGQAVVDFSTPVHTDTAGYNLAGLSFMGTAMGRSYFHLHLVSDSTGETLIAASRAASAQYQGVASIEHVYPLVRTPAQLERVIAEIENAPGIVLFTLVDSDLSRRLEDGCEASGSPCLRVLGPILNLFKSYLGQNSTPRAGAQHMLNADYFKRIDALNFTMMSDDGQLPENLEHADIVLARRQPHVEDADEHLSRQSRLQDRQHPAACPTCRCRGGSIIFATR